MVSDFIAKKTQVVKDYKLADNSVPEETKKKLRSRLNICETMVEIGRTDFS